MKRINCERLFHILAFLVLATGVAAKDSTGTFGLHPTDLAQRIPRGGAGNAVAYRRRKSRSSLDLKEKMTSFQKAIEVFTDRTYFSKDLMPQSCADSEWAAFVKGWLLIALPIPLPIVFICLFFDSFMLSFSKWDDAIKRKYIIGLYHGVLVFSVVLRELDDKIDFITRPRNVLILFNLATNLFLGKNGRSRMTKKLMDSATYATLFYILYVYFETPSSEMIKGKRWF